MTDSVVQETAEVEATDHTYRGILKSTSLIGGASILNILIGMVRTKFIAILLGPVGVGLLGLYTQIATLVSSVTGMGIGNSGVRQVAEAVGTGDGIRIARTVITLRRTAWLTGGFGLLAMVIFCVPISRITFKSDNYAGQIALLGATLLIGSITAGQSCVLRGTRRIVDVARITVIGALCGTMVSIPCYYLWGIRGIVPSLILSAIAALVASWWYARRVAIAAVVMSWQESRQEARTLLSLGLSFMGAGLLGSATTYLIQVLLIRQFSLAAFGIYQAAFSLSGVLVGFVLSAMGADYYPRLTAVAGDNASIYRMVNEQSQISILLSLPGLAAMMIFAPLIIKIFYANSFTAATPILRWFTLGMLGRVISWPLGFVILAKGKGKLYFVTELFADGLQLASVYYFTQLFGLEGAGIAFTVLYVVHSGFMLWVMHRLVGRSWAVSTVRLTLLATLTMVLLLLNCTLNNHEIVVWLLNLCLLAVVTTVCLRQLADKSGVNINTLLTKISITIKKER